MKSVLVATLLSAGAASAQSLSPEDITRMLDEQAAQPNPYAALLNDPDPARSLGAMRIMMESGDPALMEMALEFGLLSADENVQRYAVEQHFHQKPILAVKFDGSELNLQNNALVSLRQLAVTGMGGTIEPNGVAYGRWRVGDYSDQGECWSWDGGGSCAIVSRPEGFFIDGDMANRSFDGRVIISDEGTLEGTMNIERVGAIPVTIRLLD